jgi:C_GCAxxG_C_C family probable redox protein
MTTATKRHIRRRATVNMLRMGHCAPSIAKTLLDATAQKKDWAVKLAAGMPGGIANTGYECGGVTSPLVVLGLRHSLRLRDGLPEVVCQGQALCQQFEKRNGTLSCVAIRGGPDRISTRCPRIVMEAPEMFFAVAESNDDVITAAPKSAYRRAYAHFTGAGFHCARSVLERLHADPEVLNAASAFVGGTVFRGVTCSALTAGVMVLGLREGAIEDSPLRVLKMAAIMLAGGNALADHLNEFNRLTNRGHELAEWFAHEVGSTLCRDITHCDFAQPQDVERYIDSGCINRCRSITEKVAQRVEAMT